MMTQAMQDARQLPSSDWTTRTTHLDSRIERVDDGHLLLGKSKGHQNCRIHESFSRCHICTRIAHTGRLKLIGWHPARYERSSADSSHSNFTGAR